jgi:hypothetical protein
MAAVNLPTAIQRRCRYPLDHRGRAASLELTLEHIRCTEMKTLLLAGVTLTFLTGVDFSRAMAHRPKFPSGNAWAGISQRVEPALQMPPQ